MFVYSKFVLYMYTWALNWKRVDKTFYLYSAQMFKMIIKVVKIGVLDSFKPCNFQLRVYFYDLIDSWQDSVT